MMLKVETQLAPSSHGYTKLRYQRYVVNVDILGCAREYALAPKECIL